MIAQVKTIDLNKAGLLKLCSGFIISCFKTKYLVERISVKIIFIKVIFSEETFYNKKYPSKNPHVFSYEKS